jgi:methionine-S-sulfoxide reductase
VRTRVGYSGGTKQNPTYYNLGDHSETVEMDYDTTEITYAQLLEVFWNSHKPVYQSTSCQYKSVIFYHNEKQHKIALESKAKHEKEEGSVMYTEIVPYEKLWLAEEYHQKYYLQVQDLFRDEFMAMYPDFNDIINSTAAARVNGYMGHEGTWKQLEEEIDSLGLSDFAKEVLRGKVGIYTGH